MDGRTQRSRFAETRRSSLDSHEVELVQNPQHQQHKGTSQIQPEEMIPDDLGLRPRSGTWFTWWKLELLAVTLATACMAAIIGLLLHFHDRPITSWPQTDFSLNSVVALLATLAEACLMSAVTSCIGQRKWRWFLHKSQRESVVVGVGGLGSGDGGDRRRKLLREFEVFDDSSRGLLGSVKFFGKIGFRDIAFIGAAITILSLLFNTLTQNLVRTQVRMRVGTPLGQRAGEIARSTSYDNWVPGDLFVTPAADLSTLSAMYTGMLSSNISDLPVSCPTGNCTYPVVPSLGVCGACMDVTSSLVESCPNSTTCRWAIPHGAELVNPSKPAPSSYSQPAVFKVDTGPGRIWNASTAARDASLVISNFNIIGQSRSVYNASATGSGATPKKLSNVVAHECGLWFCVNTHRTNVSLGIAPQEIQAHWNKAKAGVEFTDISNFTNIPKEFNVEDDVAYSISVRSMLALSSGINALLFGTVAASNPGEVSFIGYSGIALDGLKGLWYAADDIDGWVNNLAKSLTNNIRLTGTTQQQNATLYDGTAWTEEVYFFVSWLWMIFPWTLVFLSIAFLTITIIGDWRRTPVKNNLYEQLEVPPSHVGTGLSGNGSNMSLTELTIRMNAGGGSFKSLPVDVR